MNNYEAPYGVIFGSIAIAIFAGGAIMGLVLSETGNITQGRNEGIVFCSEKPKECAVEYSYIKLKEAQK